MWLHVPSTCSPSAPGSECTTLDSGRLSMLERSATSSGKHSPPRSWSALWKRVAWMRRLSGLTLPLSMLDRGAALWTESLAASRASLGVRPASEKERPTNAGSGLTSLESFGRLNRHCASSKTCLDLFQPVDLSTSFLTLPPSGSMRNGVICQQAKLALRTKETGSGFWPSSRAEDSESCGNHPGATDSLSGAVQEWPTPSAEQWGGSAEQHPARKAKMKDGANRTTVSELNAFTENWKTPHGMAGMDKTGKAGAGGEFAKQVEHWQTPASDSFRSRGGDRVDEMGLDQQSRFWSTPHAHNASGAPGAAHSENEGRRRDLVRETTGWPTPAARDHKGANSEEHATLTGGGRKHMDQLSNFVAYSPLAQAIQSGEESSLPVVSVSGEPLSPTTQPLKVLGRQRLNPAFVSWLMGLPWWWTNPAVTSSVQSEMEAYRFALRSRLSDLLGEQSDD